MIFYFDDRIDSCPLKTLSSVCLLFRNWMHLAWWLWRSDSEHDRRVTHYFSTLVKDAYRPEPKPMADSFGLLLNSLFEHPPLFSVVVFVCVMKTISLLASETSSFAVVLWSCKSIFRSDADLFSCWKRKTQKRLQYTNRIFVYPF